MYTQGLDSLGKDCLRDEAQDGARLESRFQARVDAEEKIEAKDPRTAAWASLCQALLGTAEFRYLK